MRQVLIASEVTRRLPADVTFTLRVTRDVPEAEEPLVRANHPALPVAAPGCRELCWLEGRKEVRGGGKPGTYRSAAQSGIISVSNTQRTAACLPLLLEGGACLCGSPAVHRRNLSGIRSGSSQDTRKISTWLPKGRSTVWGCGWISIDP